MFKSNLISRILVLILATILLLAPVAAQKRTGAPRKSPPQQVSEPTLTFDTLLTEDSYKVYFEVRNVGQLVRSNGFNDLINPLIKVAEPPKEIRTLLKWIDAHAEALATSRMFLAAWPSRSDLPTALIAVEFLNADEATKFETQLKVFIPKLMPKPTPTPSGSPAPPNSPTLVAPSSDPGISGFQYAIKQSGSLVLLSDKPISLAKLKPRGSKLLFEDPNFALARNRFPTEPVFLYVNVKSIEDEQLEQRKKWEKEAEEQRAQETKTVEARVPEGATESETPTPEVASELEALSTASPEYPPPADPPTEPTPAATEAANNSAMLDMFAMSFWSLIFGGQSNYPDAVGVALAFEEEGYILRALLVNEPGAKGSAIPFITQLASGPALVPATPNVIPADTDIFVSFSLDYLQMYDAMAKSITGAHDFSRRVRNESASASPPESPFADYEKKLGLKVKEDILPLLGNELAFALLTKPAPPESQASPSPGGASASSGPTVTKAPDLNPVIAVALRDKEAVRRLIPKIIDSMGLKGASLFAQTEKREETELVSYANMFSYAFIGDFLVLSPDAATTRRVVDSYLTHKTLASDSNFRNAIRWQPREVQGQIYAGPGLIDLYNPFGNPAAVNDKMMGLLGQLNPVINPLTYALSDDGRGSLHELHLPRNLLMLVIAGITSGPNESPIFTNESIAQTLLRAIVSAEGSYHSSTGDGRYGTLEELEKAGFLSKEMFEKNGYRVEVSVMSNKFEATATPIEYGKTGRVSYFVDESGVVRGGDHAGGAATISDKPVE